MRFENWMCEAFSMPFCSQQSQRQAVWTAGGALTVIETPYQQQETETITIEVPNGVRQTTVISRPVQHGISGSRHSYLPPVQQGVPTADLRSGLRSTGPCASTSVPSTPSAVAPNQVCGISPFSTATRTGRSMSDFLRIRSRWALCASTR